MQIKLTMAVSSGYKDVDSSCKHFKDEIHHMHDKSQLLNHCVNLRVENCISLVLKHLLQLQASDESDEDMFVDS
jgi:hypothetical protein